MNKIVIHILSVLSMVLMCCSQNAVADTTLPGSLFLFPTVDVTNTSGSAVADDEEKTEIEAGIDLFYSYSGDQFLALVEYFVNRDENEFERVQVGWKINPETKLWFGRYHSILGYWNSNYHHGAYLQTSISRPAIAEFEDDGGVLPMHTTGALLSNEHLFSEGKLNFDLSLGYGPTMESGDLEPADIFSLGGETYHENITFKLTYFPGLFANSQLGLFAGYTRIEGDGVTIKEINQNQYGVFGLFENDNLSVLSCVFFIDNTIESATSGADTKDDFISGYIQFGYLIDDKWTVYARLEDTFDDENDAYLALIPDYISKREVAGLRYDIIPKHALTLEFK